MRKVSLTTSKILSLLLLAVLVHCRSNPEQHPTEQTPPKTFIDITSRSRLQFHHDPGVDGSYFMPESLGSGAAFFDFDQDGDLDIYFVNGARGKLSSEPLRNRLFQQENNGTYTDVTAASGLGDTGYGMGIAVGDIDNDGDIDVYVTNYGPDALYLNNGNGTFVNITSKAGIQDSEWSTSAAFLDYDQDGLLDLYIANYLHYDPAVRCTDKAGRPEYCGPKGFDGVEDLLYHNNGNGTFTDVSLQSGIASVAMKGLGVVIADFNGDAYADIYVANDGEPNLLWINQKDGTFQDRAVALGAALNDLGQPEGSMGVDAADADGDGDIDLFMTHLHDEKNTFYRNEGDIGFSDDSLESGLAGPSLPFTGFGTGFFDYDNDGDQDLAVVNGRIERAALLTKTWPPNYWDHYAEPDLLFENQGKGTYRDVSNQGGDFFSDIRTGRGLAFGDVDNDGDIDLLVTNTGGPAKLFRNDCATKGHWLILRALDPALKRDSVGARIEVQTGNKRLVRFVNPAYSYLSSNDPRVHFGLGPASSVDQILVRWPDGTKESFPGIPADKILTLTKGSGK